MPQHCRGADHCVHIVNTVCWAIVFCGLTTMYVRRRQQRQADPWPDVFEHQRQEGRPDSEAFGGWEASAETAGAGRNAIGPWIPW